MADQTYMPAMSIPQAAARFNTLVEFVQKVMRPDVDYGIIPGTPKPTLLKPGAEKLTTLFGLTTRFVVVDKTEDWTGDQHGGEPFFYYWYRCQLWRGERLIAEADGSCNSRESKYRWRNADRKCPNCDQATIKRSKFPPKGAAKDAEPGWYCYAKVGGCGAEFGAKDPAILGQQTGRTPNPDICDQVNTFQKMSQKRAMIAATLIGVNASEFFTQDVEDIQPVGNGASYTPPVQVVDTGTGEVTTITTQQQPVDDLAVLADAVKRLREAERAIAGEPPAFTWSKKQGRAALEAEQAASRARLHTWLTAKVDAAPALDELDDASLIDVAYTAAGL